VATVTLEERTKSPLWTEAFEIPPLMTRSQSFGSGHPASRKL
jgi:hypothetical protein